MTAAQRKARADICRYAVEIEIELRRVARATMHIWRQHHQLRADRLAKLALNRAPLAAQRGAA